MNFLIAAGNFAFAVFNKDKFIGKLAQWVTAAAVAYASTQIPVVPEWVTVGFQLAFDLKPGVELTPAAVTGVLTPLVKIGISDLIQSVQVKWANRVLRDLKESPASSYIGKIDGFVGPKALEAIDDLLHRIQ
jgi:hypothetical protein